MWRMTHEQPSMTIRAYSEKDAAVFCRVRERFGALSNMAGGFPLEIAGVSIRSTEAYYQAIRWAHRPDIQHLILEERSPIIAKRTAYRFLTDARADWDHIKVRVMRFALRAKLAFHREAIQAVLADTDGRAIVEKSQRDTFWGCTPSTDGTLRGRNVLGRLWMELRAELDIDPHRYRDGVPDPGIPRDCILGREIQSIDPPEQPRQPGLFP